jgi:membrane protease YdiL (CAAX protease family)
MVAIGSTGVLAAGRWRWLRAMAWMVALGAALVVAFNLVTGAVLWVSAAASGGEFTTRSAAPAGHKLAAALAGAAAVLALYGIAVRLGERRRVQELGLRPLPSEMLIGLAIGGALIGLIVGSLWLLGWVGIESRSIDGVAIALRDSIRSGVVEEVVLRLVIFRLLWRAFGIWPAIAGSALLFGALHLGNPDSSLLAAIALIAGEGIGIGLYLITGRIWASIGMHAAWNFTLGWIFGAAVSGTSDIAGGPLAMRPVPAVPGWLSGGGFGPEASLVALVVSLLASAGILYHAWKHGHFTAADSRSHADNQSSGYSSTTS